MIPKCRRVDYSLFVRKAVHVKTATQSKREKQYKFGSCRVVVEGIAEGGGYYFKEKKICGRRVK
jgi:hypothetical protein